MSKSFRQVITGRHQFGIIIIKEGSNNLTAGRSIKPATLDEGISCIEF
ncbi:MAG: hypothetical protein WKI04_14215 [Ferruginibacter sp.]